MIDNNDNIKIVDFGLSAIIRPGILFSAQCGSPAYWSPEMIRGQTYRGPEVDIWALGVTLYAMVTGNIPWEGKTDEEKVGNALRGNFTLPADISDDCKKLIGRMLTVNASSRATISEILSSSWLPHPKLVSNAKRCSDNNNDYQRTHSYDNEVLRQMEELGFSKEQTILDLDDKNFLSQAYVTYHLMMSKKENRATTTPEKRSNERTPPTSPSKSLHKRRKSGEHRFFARNLSEKDIIKSKDDVLSSTL
jgi:serine/threonine protein kinase